MTIKTYIQPNKHLGNGDYLVDDYYYGRSIVVDFGVGCLVLHPDSTATPEEYGDDYPKVTHEEFMDNNWCVELNDDMNLAYNMHKVDKFDNYKRTPKKSEIKEIVSQHDSGYHLSNTDIQLIVDFCRDKLLN